MTINTTPHTPAAVRNRDGLAVIGRTLHDLRGIRFDGDEGGNAPAGQQPAGGQPTPGQQPAGQQHQRSTSAFPGPASRGDQPAPAPTGDPVPGAAPSGPDAAPSGDPTPGSAPAPGQRQRTYTPEETEQYVHAVREEARQHREAREAAEAALQAERDRANAVLRAAGVQLNDKGEVVPYTPTVPTEQAQAQTAQVQSERDNTQRENLVLRVSPSLKADADKLLDSRSFTDQLHALQPDDRTGAEALVAKWVKDHPEHGLAPLPAASSGATAHAGGALVNGRKPREEALKARISGRKAS